MPDRSDNSRNRGRVALLATAAAFTVAVIGLAAWMGTRDGDQRVDATDPGAEDAAGGSDDGVDDTTTDDGGPPAPLDVDLLTSSTWTLRFGGGPAGDVPIVDGWPITLTFTEDSLGGTVACNSYGARYTIDGFLILIDEMGQTSMGCLDEVMASERAYLSALADVGEILVEGERLILGGPSTELIFQLTDPAPMTEVVGRTWLLEGMNDGSGDDVLEEAQGEPATLALADDGTFTGSTGCRTIAGEYVVNGNEILFTSWGADGDCPTSLRDQDSRVVTVLGDGFVPEILDGDVPRLLATSTGNETLLYRAVGQDELADTPNRPAPSDAELLAGIEWFLTGGYGEDPQTPTIPDPRTVDPGQPITLVFGDDGTVRGQAVCNPYTADAEVGDGGLLIGVVEATEEGCEGDLNRIASAFLAALPLMTEFGIEDDGRTLVMNGDGVELHFERGP